MPRAGKALAGFVKRYVDDLLRVPVRSAGRHADDVARAGSRHADDVARAGGRKADDAVQGAARQVDEAGPPASRPGFTPDGRINPEDFRTGPNQAHYWSGRTADGQGVMTRAAEVAENNGGTTLETLMARRGIELPQWDPDNPAVMRAWDEASAAFANGAQGRVRVVLGDQLRPGNIWETTEYPRLLRNERVSEVVRVDPTTGREFPYP